MAQDEYTFAVDGLPGLRPGRAHMAVAGDRLIVANDTLRMVWSLDGGVLRPALIRSEDEGVSHSLQGGEAFSLTLADGTEIPASTLAISEPPVVSTLGGDPTAQRVTERSAGREARALLVHERTGTQVAWRVTLRDGSNYLCQTLQVTAGDGVEIAEISAPSLPLGGRGYAGAVQGSPATAGAFFVFIEHPMSNASPVGAVRCSLDLPAGSRTATVTSVIGTSAPGQMRRSFLYYLERRRPHPYRQFLHYNSWWDIAWMGRQMNEELCADRISSIGEALTKARGVEVDSYVFDDGWDDFTTLWKFHDGFPDGFKPLGELAARHGSGIGTWISPWGGYGHEQQARVRYAREQGFETQGGLRLAKPKYYERFREVCRSFISEQGCNYFKFDGIGGGNYATGAPESVKADLQALFDLCDDLREQREDLFINATVGTWPSPAWLLHVDSIWRQGEDLSHRGWGTPRDKWITYRDGIVYQRVVRSAPLYPVNSLMLAGLVMAELGSATTLNNDLEAMRRDVRGLFGSGINLQELYITPSLFTDEHWDALAEAVKWAQVNEDVLVDTHWVGGDAIAGEVYGFASWSPDKETLMLRNPRDDGQICQLDIGLALELPAGEPSGWKLRSAYPTRANMTEMELVAGQPVAVELEPLEVLVWDAVPAGGSTAYEGCPDLALGHRPATRDRFVGVWEYEYQGQMCLREYRADGTAKLTIGDRVIWDGFTWEWADGHVYAMKEDGTLDCHHVLSDDGELLFLSHGFGPARRK